VHLARTNKAVQAQDQLQEVVEKSIWKACGEVGYRLLHLTRELGGKLTDSEAGSRGVE